MINVYPVGAGYHTCPNPRKVSTICSVRWAFYLPKCAESCSGVAVEGAARSCRPAMLKVEG